MGYSDTEIRTLIDQLKNHRWAKKRREAAFELGLTDSALAFSGLKSSIRNESDSDVRLAILHSLAEIDIDNAKSIIMKVLRKDEAWEVREGIIYLILEYYLEDAETELVSLLEHDDDYDVRANAAFVLGVFAKKSCLSFIMNAAIDDPNIKVRKNATEALSYFDYTKKVRDRINEILLFDNNYEVRLAAVETLVLADDKKTKNTLIDAFQDERSSIVKLSILNKLESMDSISDEEFVTFLKKVMKFDLKENVRHKVIELFSDHSQRESIIDNDIINDKVQTTVVSGNVSKTEYFKAIISEQSLEEKLEVLDSLLSIESESDELVKFLINVMIQETDYSYKRNIANRISSLNYANVGNLLIDYVNQPNSSLVNFELLVNLLSFVKTDEAKQNLEELLEYQDNPLAITIIIEALANSDFENSKEILRNYIRNSKYTIVLNKLLDIFSIRNDLTILPDVYSLLKRSKSSKIRQQILKKFSDFLNENYIDILIEILNEDNSLKVRQIASNMLGNLRQKYPDRVRDEFSKYKEKVDDKEENENINSEDLAFTTDNKLRILFAAANPKDTYNYLQQGREIKFIDQKLRIAQKRHYFNINQEWAISKIDFIRCLTEFKPHILHLTCHGDYSNNLIFEDLIGNTESVSFKEIIKILKVHTEDDEYNNLKIVFVSACNSEQLADELSNYVDYVIAMSETISDEGGTNFAGLFYQQIAYKKSVKTAFKTGVIGLSDDEEDVPDLFFRDAVNFKSYNFDN